MTSRRALVTGATGFVGRHLVRNLRKSGWCVDAIIRPQSDRMILSEHIPTNRVHVYSGSSASMQAILDCVKPDVVFHLASLFISEHQPSDVERLIQSNLLFGAQLIEAMAQTETSCLVNTGTSWQHYNDQQYSPVNFYAATKQAFEALLQYYVEAHDFRIITLKLHDTYGLDDPRPKLINLLRDVAESGRSLAMTSGEQLIDLVHVEDVVQAYLLSADYLINRKKGCHESYAIASGNPISIRKLVYTIEEILGRKLPIKWGEREYRQREVMRPWQGNLLPGWKQNLDLKTGLVQIFARERTDYVD